MKNILTKTFKYYILYQVIMARLWLVGQAVKTPPFHGGNTGSIPVGVIRALKSKYT